MPEEGGLSSRLARLGSLAAGVSSPTFENGPREGLPSPIAPIIELKWPESLPLGKALQRRGGPRTAPADWPKPPNDPRASAYWDTLYGYFDFFCDFTANGKTIGKDVLVNEALRVATEVDPKTGVEHVAVQLTMPGLQRALNKNKESKTDVYFNDLARVRIDRKKDAKPPPGPISAAFNKVRPGPLINERIVIKGRPGAK